jgi:hypothetical protein
MGELLGCAVRTQTADDDLRSIRLESGSGGGAAGPLEIEWDLHVLDATAAAADHVVVRIASRVPEERAATAVDAPDYAELLEELESGVDGGERDARQALACL